MNTKPLLPSLLLVALAAGITLQAHAARDEATSLPAQSCQSAHHELAAIAVHLREARADRSDEATAPSAHEKLALELEAHLEALQARLPVQATQRAQASVLLSDMRDALVLMRGATHLDARWIAVQRLEDDRRFYNRVLDTVGCPTPRSTSL